MEAGQKKLANINYERLELSRWRAYRWNEFMQKADCAKVRLDAPAELVSHLRVYGVKDGESHLVFKTYYTPERLKVIQNIVDIYNRKKIDMHIVEYFSLPESSQKFLLEEIGKANWTAAHYLFMLLKNGEYKKIAGADAKVFCLVQNGGEEKDTIVSFCTYSELDEIRPSQLHPWIGAVYTFPEFRGYRYAGRVIEHCENLARTEGREAVYISTDHVGLYEKYGYSFFQMDKNSAGDACRVYRKLLHGREEEKMSEEEVQDTSSDPRVRAARITLLWMFVSYVLLSFIVPIAERRIRLKCEENPQRIDIPNFLNEGCYGTAFVFSGKEGNEYSYITFEFLEEGERTKYYFCRAGKWVFIRKKDNAPFSKILNMPNAVLFPHKINGGQYNIIAKTKRRGGRHSPRQLDKYTELIAELGIQLSEEP